MIVNNQNSAPSVPVSTRTSSPLLSCLPFGKQQMKDVSPIGGERVSSKPSISENFKYWKALAQAKTGAIPNEIQNLTEPHRLEIFKVLIARDPSTLERYLQYFNLSEKSRFQAVSVSKSDRIYNIALYDLTEEHRFNIYMKVAAQRGKSCYIDDLEEYDLSDDHILEVLHFIGMFTNVKLLKIVSKEKDLDRLADENVSNIMKKLKKVQFEAAKFLAAQNGRATCKRLNYFELTHEQEVEVFKIAVVQDAEGAFLHFSPPSDPALALFVASSQGVEFSGYVEKFSLSEEKRFEAAKTAAPHDGSLPIFIGSYKLTQEEQRYELAQISAEKFGGTTAEHIKGFELTAPHAFEIAKLIATKNGVKVSQFLHLFPLSEEERFEVAKLAVRQDRNVFHLLNKYTLTQPHYDEVVALCRRPS